MHKGRINWAQLVIKRRKEEEEEEEQMKVAKGIMPRDGGVWVGYDKDMLYTCLKSLGNEKI